MSIEKGKIIHISRAALHEMGKKLGSGPLNKSGSDIVSDTLREEIYKMVCMYSGKPSILVQQAWNIRSISLRDIMTLPTRDLSTTVRSFSDFGGAY